MLDTITMSRFNLEKKNSSLNIFTTLTEDFLREMNTGVVRTVDTQNEDVLKFSLEDVTILWAEISLECSEEASSYLKKH